MSAGLVTETPDGNWLCHDYLEHQRSADEVAALREKRRTAGTKGGLAKAANALALAKQTGSKALPESETDTDKNLKETSSKLTKDTDPRFVEFWSVYPKRSGKGDAMRALAKVLAAGVPIETVVNGAMRYRDDPKRSPDYTAHPATWLNRGSWDDEPAQAPRTSRVDPMTALSRAARNRV